MVNKLLGSAGVSEGRESTKVDKVGKYLDHLFNPWEEPNGIFLYDWEDLATGVDGASLFSKAVHSEAYKKWEDTEKELYRTNKHDIIGSFSEKNAKNIVDMGPGDGDKSGEILSSTLGDRLEGKTYIPVDISAHFVKQSSEEVQHYVQKHNNIRIHIAGVNIDFLESSAGLKDMKDKLYMMLGGSIGNFSDEDIVKILRNMASDGGKKNNIIMSYFMAPDKKAEDYDKQIQELCARYGDSDTTNPYYNQSTHEAVKDWIMGGFGSLGIDTSKLEFFVRYDEANTKMVLGAKVKETIIVTHNGKNYTKQAGEELLAIQSKRFTQSKLQNLADQAGVTIKSTHTHEGMGMAIMESDRTPEAKQKKRDKQKLTTRSLIAATILGGTLWAGTEIGRNAEEKERKETLDNIKKQQLEPRDFNYETYAKQTNEEKAKYFNERIEEFYSTLYTRYDLSNLSDSKQRFVKILLEQWLLTQDESVIDITMDYDYQGLTSYHSNEKRAELIESFIDNNRYTLASTDISLKLHENFIPYEAALKNTFSTITNDISIPQFKTVTHPRVVSSPNRSGYKWIGPYTAMDGKTYIAAIYDHHGKDIIVGCKIDIRKGEDRDERLERYKTGKLVGHNSNEYKYADFTSEVGKVIADDYFKKPYFHRLTMEIAHAVKNNNDVRLYNTSEIISTLTYRAKEGHDFGWLLYNKDETVMNYFLHTYLGFIFKERVPQYDKSDQIHSIFTEVHKYLKNTIDVGYNDRGKLESAIFHRLCTYSLYSRKQKNDLQRWINNNIDLFEPFMKKGEYPHRINPEKESILSDAKIYHKKNAADIKANPGLINLTIYNYEDMDGNLFEVSTYQGVLYARYITPDWQKPGGVEPDISTYLIPLRDKIIEGCKKEGIGMWDKNLLENQKGFKGTASESHIIAARSNFIQNEIVNKLTGYNSEVGNLVIQDYMKRKNLAIGGVAPH